MRTLIALFFGLATPILAQVANIHHPGRIWDSIPHEWSSGGMRHNGYERMTYRHYEDGWRQSVAHVATNIVTTPIPAPLQAVIAGYKGIMESRFGEGAHLNHELDEGTVALMLSLDEEFPADTALRLKTWSDIIAASYGSTFRADIYDAEEIVTEEIVTEYEVIE